MRTTRCCDNGILNQDISHICIRRADSCTADRRFAILFNGTTSGCFYTGITDKDIRECLRNMAAITKVCAVAPGKRRTVIAKLTGTDGKTPLKVMIPAEPDPDYSRLDPVLLQLYEEAEQRFPEMLLQLYSHMTYNAPLEKEFEPVFG